MTPTLVGLVAGFASALLFAVVITGSPLAILLSYVAPLPVLIAALGWRHRAGLVAAIAGAVALGIALRPVSGVTFALGVALPAWGIGYLALLGRDDGNGGTEWYPLGRILLWIAGISAAVTVAGAVAISGDHETYVRLMRSAVAAVLSGDMPGMPRFQLPDDVSVEDVAATLANLVPIAAAASFVPMIVANLWLAAKAVHISGRLPRPWSDIPSLTLPRSAALLLLVAAAAAALLPGFLGFAGTAAVGALVAALTLAGLAGVHDLTRGKPWRLPVLISLYVVLAVSGIGIVMLPALALWGLIDCLFGVRDRRSGPPSPSHPKT